MQYPLKYAKWHHRSETTSQAHVWHLKMELHICQKFKSFWVVKKCSNFINFIFILFKNVFKINCTKNDLRNIERYKSWFLFCFVWGRSYLFAFVLRNIQSSSLLTKSFLRFFGQKSYTDKIEIKIEHIKLWPQELWWSVGKIKFKSFLWIPSRLSFCVCLVWLYRFVTHLK